MIPPGKTTQMITPRHQGHMNVSRKDARQDGSSRLPPDACHQPSTTTTSSSTVIFQKRHTEEGRSSPVPLEHDDDDNTTAQPLITVELTSPEEAGLGADMIPLCAEGGWTVRYHRRSQSRNGHEKNEANSCGRRKDETNFPNDIDKTPPESEASANTPLPQAGRTSLHSSSSSARGTVELQSALILIYLQRMVQVDTVRQ